MGTLESIPRIKLSDFFNFPKPKYILGTTYTLSLAFFESLIWYDIKKDHLHRCIILCDQKGFRRAVSEAGALRHAANSYMVATAPLTHAFHPKVWILLSDDKISMLVGSGNLTQSGFIENIELFDIVELSSKEQKGSKELAEDIIFFLMGLKEMWAGAVQGPELVLSTLDEMTDLIEQIGANLTQSEDPPIRFLSSFGGDFAEQLLERVPDCKALYVAAPYFGASVEGLSSLQETLKPQQTIVFPAVDKDGKINVRLEDVLSLPSTSLGTLKINEADGKFAHFKLYGMIGSDEDSWLFNGSVNCTAAALQAKNVEAGILRRVPQPLLTNYFQASEIPLAGTLGVTVYEHSDSRWFTCWATNIGKHIEILASNDSLPLAPLNDLALSIRSGSSTISAAGLDSLSFKDGKAVLPWSIFGEVDPEKGEIWLVDFTAISCSGHKVQGACFIDNLWVLSSSPEQRSALRAITTLTSGESLPEYYDILSVFRLLDETLTVSGEIQQMEGSSWKSEKGNKPIESDEQDSVPLWPPVPLKSVAGLSTKKKSSLYWFQNIMSALLRPSMGDVKALPGIPRAEDSDEGMVDENTVDKATAKVAAKTFNQVLESFFSLERKLSKTIITEDISQKIWPVATAIILIVLSIRKKTPSEILDHRFPAVSDLISQSVSMLFRDREQSPDYCTPKECRYRYRIFPSVAEDLSLCFNAEPHPHLAIHWLAVFCYLHASTGFPLNAWLLCRTLLGKEASAMLEDENGVKNIFEHYLRDENVPITWKNMAKSLTELRKLTWSNHPGWQDLSILQDQSLLLQGDSKLKCPHLKKHVGLIKRVYCGQKVQVKRVDKHTEYCISKGCPKMGLKNPGLHVLRDQLPAVCDGCGSVLVPTMLHKAYFG